MFISQLKNGKISSENETHFNSRNYTFVQSIPDDVGVIVVTGQQMKGQGWLVC